MSKTSYQTFEAPSAIDRSLSASENVDEIEAEYPFGVPVYVNDFETQMAFIRKTYAIFSFQLIIINGVTVPLLYVESARHFVQREPWVWWLSFIFSVLLLLGLTYKSNDQYQPPPLLVLLFTFSAAYVIGSVTALLNLVFVFDSLIMLLVVSLALVCYTYQNNYKFKSKQTIIYAFVMLTVSAVLLHPLAFPIVDVIPALTISSILCTFFILDMFYLMQTLTKLEYWAAAMQLYLDLVVPFRSIHHICEVTAEEE